MIHINYTLISVARQQKSKIKKPVWRKNQTGEEKVPLLFADEPLAYGIDVTGADG